METPNLETPCPQCGAFPQSDETCLERFHELMIFDLQDTAYFAVHHLVVTGYMVQHADELSNEGFDSFRRHLAKFERGELQTSHSERYSEFREQAGAQFAGDARVIRKDPQPRVRIPWTQTVFDVDFSSGEAYVQTVEDWVRNISRDLERHAL